MIVLFSCGKTDFIPPPPGVEINKSQTAENLNKFYGTEMKNLYIRVFYETGAEPYAGNNSRDQPIWGLLEQNIKQVFETRNQTVTFHVPKDLSEMSEFPAQNKLGWKTSEIVQFAEGLGVPPTTNQTAYFTIVFVKGGFDTGQDITNSVLGVSIAGTTIIAIFKDAIRLLGPSDQSLTVKFGEQATLVHEMGHALGIVANGVNAVEDHHDEEHGSHCSNSSCVMYWMNEGNKDLLEFIQGIVQNGNVTLYGQQCLDDIKAYNP